jgi:hypothetical protein
MQPDVALTWPFNRPARLGVAWILWSLAPGLAPRAMPSAPHLCGHDHHRSTAARTYPHRPAGHCVISVPG